MTNLSPAAQAILTAVTQRQYSCDPIDVPEATGRIKYEAAAVLRAAADQVVPETNSMFISPAELQQEKTRDQLLAIANELEATA
jgi:hypothetical protein